MKTRIVSVGGAALLVCLAAVLTGLPGCKPDAALWDNPLDPYNEDYVMQFPVIGNPAPGANRQVTITVYYVDQYASLLLVERKNGSIGNFVQVGTAPASQQVFIDTVPVTEGPVLWYRVRLQAPGGALSPYSSSVYVALP